MKSNIIERIQKWRDSGNTIVFTNGCFDILHRGHVHYLHEAKKLGGKLIVGLNSDLSVQRIKGTDRPFIPEDDRGIILKSLAAVDEILIFHEDTPLKLIEDVRPDILVKGGDYSEDDIVGAELVKTLGGAVVVIPFLKGFSSSKIVNQIRNN